MTCNLAWRGKIVVAAQTAGVETGMVEPREAPVADRVAIRTLQRGRDMAEAFSFGDHVVVAIAAQSRGTAKHSAAMAFLTIDPFMGAFERKAGLEMVVAIDYRAFWRAFLQGDDRTDRLCDGRGDGRYETDKEKASGSDHGGSSLRTPGRAPRDTLRTVASFQSVVV